MSDPTTTLSGAPPIAIPEAGAPASSTGASLSAVSSPAQGGGSTPPVAPPASEPTVLSTEQGADHVQKQQNTLANVSPPVPGGATNAPSGGANGTSYPIGSVIDQGKGPQTVVGLNADGSPILQSGSGAGVKNSSTDANNPNSPGNGSATFLNPDTGESKVLNGTQLTPDMVNQLNAGGFYSTESSGTLPSWFITGNLQEAQHESSTAKAKAQLDSLSSQLNGFKTTDAQLNATIAGIKAMWDARAVDMGKVNNQEIGNLNTTGIRLGSQYTAGSFGGIIAEAERQGVQRIADLNVQRQSAILAAQQAAQTQNWKVFDEQVSLATNSYNEQQKQLDILNQAVAAQNQKVQDNITQSNTDSAIATLMKSGVTDPADIAAKLKAQGINATADTIATSLKNLKPTDATAIGNVALEAAKNGAPKAIIDAINKSNSSNDAIAAAGTYLQQGTGDVANYLQYKRDALSNNQTPEDFTTWKAADTKATNALEYGKAFAQAAGTAAGKASVENKGPVSTSPVQSNIGVTSGLTFNAPASVAPYVNFSANGVKYVDLSTFKGTPTEAHQAVMEAQAAGYKVITNKNSALDVQNITDALSKLQTIREAFSGINPATAGERDTYAAAFVDMAKKLQTDPNAAASGVFQDAALDILKAMSGTQGFRGGASMVEAVQSTFPQNTDSKDVANKKISNMEALINDRQNALVGKPSAADQLLIDGQQAGKTINDYVTNNPAQVESVTKLYGVAGATDASVLAYMQLHPEAYKLSSK